MEHDTARVTPSPSETGYKTPDSLRSRSRQTSRTPENMSTSTTPPPLPTEGRTSSRASRKRSDESVGRGRTDHIPLSDPRRFTPTLHASLISEILSLRRELENKTEDIERLEQGYHSAQTQNDALNTSLLAKQRENREIRRQMQILEGGTLSALNDVAKERDGALLDVAEFRRRLEQAQKKAKGHEESVDRTQEQWQKDRETWTLEKRSLETKVHVAEGRLKLVLDEVAKAQAEKVEESHPLPPLARSQSRASISTSPVRRTLSRNARRQSTNSVGSDHLGWRSSVLSFANGASTTLADELALEDIEEGYSSDATSEDTPPSPDALPEEHARPASSLSIKARKILGLPLDFGDIDHDRSVSVEPRISPILESPRDLDFESKDGDPAIPRSPPTPLAKPNMVSRLGSVPPRTVITPEPFPNSRGTSLGSSPGIFLNLDRSSVETSDNQWEAILRTPPMMVSTASQTVEQLPSRPWTAETNHSLATIHESAFERVETRETAVQTDPHPSLTGQSLRPDQHSSDGRLQIPVITIHPPASRPMTPDGQVVQLPPRTKNVGCQVEPPVLANYATSSMQTEEIRIDRRNLIPHPKLPPPPPPVSASASPPQSKHSPGAVRRGTQSAAGSSLRRGGPSQAPSLPPVNDNGSLGEDEETETPRSTMATVGPDDHSDEPEELGDDIFYDDELLTRPTAKFTLQRGKMVSSERALGGIGERAAVTAGERLALETIRQSEDGRPSDVQSNHLGPAGTSPPPKSARWVGAGKFTKRALPVSSRSNSMRRVAMISNGTATHSSKQSTSSYGSVEAGMPPPLPIPLRYSSARLGKTYSEGGRSSRTSTNISPTRNGRRVAKPVLRKARSGPALSPAAQAARQARSRSPSLDARVSIVPEMPTFLMPTMRHGQAAPVSFESGTQQDASAPRPSVATGPGRQPAHAKTNSDAVSMQQTSVVDAIAQTMVGEWMYKYVRRRKSFGKPEKDWDPSRSVEELSNNNSTGIRHKRWVWLAPYERCVLWSSKQPADGNSLLGKNGRKLTIKSVLDVKDDNPMPKGSVNGSHFNRSILILTPQRALKFTATSQTRHYVWLTALSFLSHSPIAVNDLTLLPPHPDDQTPRSDSPLAFAGGSLRRRPIRDSIRVAKASNKAHPGARSFTTDGSLPVAADPERPSTRDFYDPETDAALPPTIKRFHTRKRSNTAPRPPPGPFRNWSTRELPPVPGGFPSYHNTVTFSSDHGSSEPGLYTPSLRGPSIASSRRGSEASALGRPPMDSMQLHDALTSRNHSPSMMMRMDAFIDDKQAPRAHRGTNQGLSNTGTRVLPVVRRDNNFWGFEDGPNSTSPVESLMPGDLRLSESTRGSSDREYLGGY